MNEITDLKEIDLRPIVCVLFAEVRRVTRRDCEVKRLKLPIQRKRDETTEVVAFCFLFCVLCSFRFD